MHALLTARRSPSARLMLTHSFHPNHTLRVSRGFAASQSPLRLRNWHRLGCAHWSGASAPSAAIETLSAPSRSLPTTRCLPRATRTRRRSSGAYTVEPPEAALLRRADGSGENQRICAGAELSFATPLHRIACGDSGVRRRRVRASVRVNERSGVYSRPTMAWRRPIDHMVRWPAARATVSL